MPSVLFQPLKPPFFSPPLPIGLPATCDYFTELQRIPVVRIYQRSFKTTRTKKASNSTVPRIMVTFDDDLMEFWDLSGRIVNDGHDQQLALSSPAGCAHGSGSAANHR